MGHSGPRMSPRGLASAKRRGDRSAAPASAARPRGEWRVFPRAARVASGATPACCGGSNQSRWRRCGRQSNPRRPALTRGYSAVWQGIERPRRGLDGLLDAVEQLQGAALPASDWEEHVLPARVAAYTPGDLDELCTAGEVVWRGVEALGVEDGKVSLFLADQVPLLAPLSLAVPDDDPVAEQIRALLAAKGAMFFDPLATAVGGFTHDVLAALWRLVWLGQVTNDTLTPLRSLRRRRKPTGDRRDRRRASRPLGRSFRSRAPRGCRGPKDAGRSLTIRLTAAPRRNARRRLPSNCSSGTACWCVAP